MGDDAQQQGVHRAKLDATPEETLRGVAETADSWGGEWQAQGERAGFLKLPVSAGVRRGWVGYVVTASQTAPEDDTRLELRQTEEHLLVDRASVVLLLTALFGALLCLVAPVVPRLLPLLPVGFVLTVAGWLFVAGRLRNSGPEEFLELLEPSTPRDDAP